MRHRAGFEQTDFEQLAGVVPFVERLGDVDPFVALQPDQFGVEHGSQRFRDLGLADTGLAFEKERPTAA